MTNLKHQVVSGCTLLGITVVTGKLAADKILFLAPNGKWFRHANGACYIDIASSTWKEALDNISKMEDMRDQN